MAKLIVLVSHLSHHLRKEGIRKRKRLRSITGMKAEELIGSIHPGRQI
jgi:hypothetical protein